MTELEVYERLIEIALRQEEIGAEVTVAQVQGIDTSNLIAETIALNEEEAQLRAF